MADDANVSDEGGRTTGDKAAIAAVAIGGGLALGVPGVIAGSAIGVGAVELLRKFGGSQDDSTPE